MQTGTARAALPLPLPVNVRALFFVIAIPLLLAITSCHPAGQDFQECVTQAQQAAVRPAADASAPEPVTRCMAAKGWRPLRPHAEPGPAGWARTT